MLDVRNFTPADKTTLKTMVALEYSDINQRYVYPDRPCPWEPADLAKSSRVIDKHFQLAHRHRIELISAESDPYEKDYPDPHWLARFSGLLFTAANVYDGPGVGKTIFSIETYSSWYWKGQGEDAMRIHTDAWGNWFDAHAPGTDYLTMAAAVDPAAVEQIVARRLPKTLWEYGVDEPTDPTYVCTDISWSIDPDDWEAARRQLADIIESGQVPVAGKTGAITPAIVPLLLYKHSSVVGK